MDKEKVIKDEKFLKVYFIDGELLVNVNDDDTLWKKILNERERIVKIESVEWLWDLVNNKVVFQFQ
jgi:hypothetical protein